MVQYSAEAMVAVPQNSALGEPTQAAVPLPGVHGSASLGAQVPEAGCPTAGPATALGRYSFAADVWSFGCILSELCLGRVLFGHGGDSELQMLAVMATRLGPWPQDVFQVAGWSPENAQDMCPALPSAAVPNRIPQFNHLPKVLFAMLALLLSLLSRTWGHTLRRHCENLRPCRFIQA
jgi:serine/threonine protein kinase